MFTHPAIFRIGDTNVHDLATVPTGFAALDRELVGGGWPCGALTEILCDGAGLGELSMLLPAHRILAADATARAFWVAPPYEPYAPALCAAGVDLQKLVIVRAADASDALWVTEQMLAAARLVLLWQKSFIADVVLRRLQYAAAKGAGVCWLVRPSQFAAHASPARLRLVLTGEASGALTVRLLKRRGLPPNKTIVLDARALACLRRRRTPVAQEHALPAWFAHAPACLFHGSAPLQGERPSGRIL